MTDNKKLSPSEAVYGVLAWLTSRRQAVVFSQCDHAGPAAEAANEFCKVNNLEPPQGHWEKNLVHPPEPGPSVDVDNSIGLARTILQNAMLEDPELLRVYVANVAMWIYDLTGTSTDIHVDDPDKEHPIDVKECNRIAADIMARIFA